MEHYRQGDPLKKVLLVVSFGTSYAENREVTIGAVERALGKAFPAYEIRRAFTSGMILSKLRKRDGVWVDSVPEALERLIRDGVGTLVVQPTHVMNGIENDEMLAQIRRYENRFCSVVVGDPLLTATQDYHDLAQVIRETVPVPADTALVLVGHGTDHYANAAYPALSYHFQACGCKNILVGTVEGYPDMAGTLQMVQEQNVSKVIIAPLMVVAGDHANNDIAGDDPDTWQSMFRQAGYEVDCLLRGLGEYPGVQSIYVEHTRTAIARA